jgi:hypothetical protein
MPLKTEETVDLSIYPTSPDKLNSGDQLTIGDLHGNSVKFIYFLIKQGVLKLGKEAEDYQKIIAIYNKEEPLDVADLTKFKDILNRAKFTEHAKEATVRLIGDEVADRGNNDYFTLLVLKKLKDECVPTEIIFSNHSAEFVRFYEEGCVAGFTSSTMDHGGQLGSLTGNRVNNAGIPYKNQGLLGFIEENLTTSTELKELVDSAYKPNVKLLSYSIDKTVAPNTIALYSHAPIDLAMIKDLVEKFNKTMPEGEKFVYDDSTLDDLTGAIDFVNREFSKLVTDNKVSACLEEEANSGKLNDNDNREHSNIENIILNTIWNRNIVTLKRDSTIGVEDKAYGIKYVHGHVGEKVPSEPNILNLDTNLGRPGRDDGKYLVDVTNVPLPIPTLKIPTGKPPQKKDKDGLLSNVEEAWPLVINSQGKIDSASLASYLAEHKILGDNTAKVETVSPTEANDQSTWEVVSCEPDGTKKETIMRGNDQAVQFLSENKEDLIRHAVATLQSMSTLIKGGIITTTGFKPDQLITIIQQADAINRSEAPTEEKIYIKFDITSIDPSQKQLKDFIEIHNKNMDKLVKSEAGTLAKLPSLGSAHLVSTLKVAPK